MASPCEQVEHLDASCISYNCMLNLILWHHLESQRHVAFVKTSNGSNDRTLILIWSLDQVEMSVVHGRHKEVVSLILHEIGYFLLFQVPFRQYLQHCSLPLASDLL